MGTIFFLMYPEEHYIPNIRYIYLSVIAMFTLSKLIGEFVVDIQFQKQLKEKYNVLYILLDELFITLAISFTIVFFLMRGIFKPLTNAIDITLFGLCSIIFLSLYIYCLNITNRTAKRFFDRIVTTILLLKLIELVFNIGPYYKVITTTVYTVIVMTVLLVIKYLLEDRNIVHIKRYNIIKLSSLLLILSILFGTQTGNLTVFMTRPNIDSIITISGDYDIENFFVNNNKIYMQSYSGDGIYILNMNGDIENSIHVEDPISDMFVFNSEVIVITFNYNTEIIHQYSISDSNMLIEEVYGNCSENQIRVALDLDYIGKYYSSICENEMEMKNLLKGDNLLYKNEDYIVFINDDGELANIPSNNISKGTFNYSNDYFITNKFDNLEIYYYESASFNFESLLSWTSNIDDSLQFNAQNTVELDDSLLSNLFLEYEKEIIELFESTDYYYYVVTTSILYEDRYLTIYNKEGEIVSSFGFETDIYTYHDGKFYFTNNYGYNGESTIYVVDPTNQSNLILRPLYIDLELFELDNAGLSDFSNYRVAIGSSFYFYILVVSVLLITPPFVIRVNEKYKV